MSLNSSVINTLKYSDHFGFPLTHDEIYKRLISPKPTSRESVQKALTYLISSKRIFKQGEYYYLPGRKNLITNRNKNKSISKQLLSRATSLAYQLGSVPFVKAVYLTGSLAMQNSGADGDIDFMIITKEGKLWTTRLILTIYTTLLGLRRTPNSHRNSGKLCLNLYMTPTSYFLPKGKQNLYTAYELIQAVPLFDPSNTRSTLLGANPWIQNNLANFVVLPQKPVLKADNNTSLVGGIIARTFEFLAYHLQLLYMHHKLTREYITKDSAFFHPHNPADIVLAKLR